MDYNQEQFFRMQMDVPKMPFYMSYPMQNLYLTEMEYEKDMERMKELYPKEVKTILSYVEDECDKMEYEGSLMFDEYPDRLMLEQWQSGSTAMWQGKKRMLRQNSTGAE